jgi:hypothetical protein
MLHLNLASEDEIVQKDTFNLSFSPKRVCVNQLADAVLLTTESLVYKITISGHKKTIKNLYESTYPITSASFLNGSDTKTVVISDCRNGIIKITDDSLVTEIFADLPIEWKIRKEPIMGIQSHPSHENKISCWSDASIAQLTFPNASIKGKRKLKSTDDDSEQQLKTRLIDDYRPLLFFAHLPNNSDSVVVERPWISIVENFTPAFYRSRYRAQ